MKRLKIADGIHMLTMNVEDILFEGIWEIANGVTLNSYIVQGEKTAIIDGVVNWDGAPETLFKSLEEIGVDPQSIDYLIVNHMEPDHSGWISHFRKIKDDFTILVINYGCRRYRIGILLGCRFFFIVLAGSASDKTDQNKDT
jgi:anaerobic nitric oxide reductase flavorubredoxin